MVRKMLEIVSNPCVIVKKSESVWRWYFSCKLAQCRNFIAIIAEDTVRVLTNSETVCHEGMLGLPLKEAEGQKLRKD